MLKGLTTLLLLLVVSLAAPAREKREDFVLDPSKPYVYLKFDHVGPRKPIMKGEPPTGLWLRLVNNCRVPIRVPTSGYASGTGEAGVLDEIVSISAQSGITIESNGLLAENVNIGSTGGSSERKHKPVPPNGYSAEVHSSTIVAPGKSILFSFPRNHVSKDWFLRIRFTLAVNRPEVGNQPYTYLDFSEEQIPQADRQSKRTRRPKAAPSSFDAPETPLLD